jgi:hypothetical protein
MNSDPLPLHRLSPIAHWAGKVLLLSVGAALLAGTSEAQAIETVKFVNSGTGSAPSEVTVSLEEIKTFVSNGGLRQPVRDFFNSSNQEPGIVQRAFTREIEVPRNLGIEFLDTSVGQLVLSQIVRHVQSADPLPNLRTSLRTSIQNDRRISLLELIENYPTETLTLDITPLVRTYESVVAIANRLMPALESAKETVRGVVCRCEAAPGTPRSDMPSATLQAATCEIGNRQ